MHRRPTQASEVNIGILKQLFDFSQSRTCLVLIRYVLDHAMIMFPLCRWYHLVSAINRELPFYGICR